jgi:hemerythrin-like metal-binding protein
MFEWKAEYSVKVQSIDAQHKVLFNIAKELNSAMAKGQGRTVLASVLDRLVSYTVAHFAHEEGLMYKYRYPFLDEHKAQHDALTDRVKQLREDLWQGRAVLTTDVMDFLQEWLTQHIKNSDLKLAEFTNHRVAA